MISGILDLERIQTGLLKIENCKPVSIVGKVIEELRPLANDKNIELQVKIGNPVSEFRGDTEQFKRALVNLTENALKFTPNNGKVQICVENGDNNNIIFQIKDTGVGIPISQQSQVFDRFFRAEQKAIKHITGTGLGLSLVKTVVENHEGNVWFESEEGVGTTFFVSIPVAVKDT
ncbi:MAG: hypothetical protein CUN55_12675 [Phototrophicales bacterium]|nr:MAG: hypothetical protein CUN55_12675 [Phototrophicales bacterium]